MSDKEIWLVNSFGRGGLPASVIADSLDKGVSEFLMQAKLHADLLAEAEIKVVGCSTDGGLVGIYMFLAERPCLTLTKPVSSVPQEGAVPLEVNDDACLPKLAAAIQRCLIARNEPGTADARMLAVANSFTAYSYMTDRDEMVIEARDEWADDAANAFDEDALIVPSDDKIAEAIENYASWHQGTAVVL